MELPQYEEEGTPFYRDQDTDTFRFRFKKDFEIFEVVFSGEELRNIVMAYHKIHAGIN